VFAGTGAIVINDVSGGVISHVGVAATFGLVVMAMIYTLGDISGAHLNPAVSFGFWLSGRFAGRSLLPYIASQCLGAIAASLVLRILFPQHANWGRRLRQIADFAASSSKSCDSLMRHPHVDGRCGNRMRSTRLAAIAPRHWLAMYGNRLRPANRPDNQKPKLTAGLRCAPEMSLTYRSWP